jgi:hypothetical protein
MLYIFSRENLSVVAASLREAREEVEVWRSKTEDAREEAESLKLQLDSLQTEKSTPVFRFSLHK